MSEELTSEQEDLMLSQSYKDIKQLNNGEKANER